ARLAATSCGREHTVEIEHAHAVITDRMVDQPCHLLHVDRPQPLVLEGEWMCRLAGEIKHRASDGCSGQTLNEIDMRLWHPEGLVDRPEQRLVAPALQGLDLDRARPAPPEAVQRRSSPGRYR